MSMIQGRFKRSILLHFCSIVLLLLCGVILSMPEDAYAASPVVTVSVDDQFDDTNWDNWVQATGGNQSMDGTELVLTPNLGTQTGAALYNTAIDSSESMTVEFRYYSGDGTGADGFSFFLVNGTTTNFSPGNSGGSLGYSDNKVNPDSAGLDGGWLGIGFDEYGNFGSTADQDDGPYASTTPVIGLRGSEGKGYPWITGTTEASMGGNSIDGGYRRVKVTLGASDTNTLKVEWDSNDDGTYDYVPINIDLDDYAAQLDARPSSLKFGFAASTGGSTNKHSIDWFTLDTSTTVGPSLNYTEGDGAVALNSSTLTVIDTDSTNLTGSTVSISSNYASGEDELLFTDQNGITGSWNSVTGTLTLSGTTTVANYQTALRSVQYRNTSENPNITARSVSITVTDDTSATSTAFTMNINITAVNDAPVITSNGGGDTAAVSVAENTTAVTTVTATDADAGDTQTYSISGGADASKFSINSSTGALTFQSPPDYENPTDADTNNTYIVEVTVTDSESATDVQTITVTVTNVVETYTLTVTKAGTGSGTVSATGCTLSWVGNTGTCTVNSGTSITISGSSDTGSTWNGWSSGTGSASACSGTGNCTFSITQNSGVTATFTLNTYTVTTIATNGTITSTNNPTINHGSTTTVTGSANAGYYFTGVSGCGGTAQNNTNQSITTFSYTTGAITSDCTVQANFALDNNVTIPAATGNGNINLQTGSPDCGFYNVSAKTEAQVANDPSYSYPYGIIEFTLNCATADVTVTFPGDITGTTYRKYGPTTPGTPATTAWYDFTNVTVNSNTSLTLHLADGQLGDDTGVDGVIVDQGGPGQQVQPVPVPTMTEWGMIVFMLLAGLGAIYYLRRQGYSRQ